MARRLPLVRPAPAEAWPRFPPFLARVLRALRLPRRAGPPANVGPRLPAPDCVIAVRTTGRGSCVLCLDPLIRAPRRPRLYPSHLPLPRPASSFRPSHASETVGPQRGPLSSPSDTLPKTGCRVAPATVSLAVVPWPPPAGPGHLCLGGFLLVRVHRRRGSLSCIARSTATPSRRAELRIRPPTQCRVVVGSAP